MLRDQLQGCAGVEVVPRGKGWLVGRVGVEAVIVDASAFCTLEKDERDPQKRVPVVKTRWSTTAPATGQPISAFERRVPLSAERCPDTFDDVTLQQALAVPPPAVCERAFAPLPEQISLLTLIWPSLSTSGLIRRDTDDAHQEVLVLERGGRIFRLEGTITCATVGGGRVDGHDGISSYTLLSNLTLREPERQTILGRWTDQSPAIIGMACEQAVGIKGNAAKVDAFRTLLATRVVDAIAAAGP